jgi:hypothetical protein
MPSLETRIAVLEVENTTAEPLTIIRRFVSPGLALSELHSLQDKNGNEWQRKPGETEQALIYRASLECARNAGGVVLLSAE